MFGLVVQCMRHPVAYYEMIVAVVMLVLRSMIV